MPSRPSVRALAAMMALLWCALPACRAEEPKKPALTLHLTLHKQTLLPYEPLKCCLRVVNESPVPAAVRGDLKYFTYFEHSQDGGKTWQRFDTWWMPYALVVPGAPREFQPNASESEMFWLHTFTATFKPLLEPGRRYLLRAVFVPWKSPPLVSEPVTIDLKAPPPAEREAIAALLAWGERELKHEHPLLLTIPDAALSRANEALLDDIAQYVARFPKSELSAYLRLTFTVHFQRLKTPAPAYADLAKQYAEHLKREAPWLENWTTCE